MEVATCAGDVARQVGLVPSFGRGRVHSFSLTAVHQIPNDEDAGIVTLRGRSDTREGARCWGKRQVLVNATAECMVSFMLTQGQMSDTCLQGDGFTGLTVTIAIFSNNTEIIEYAACQVFNLTGSIGGSAAVGCGPFYSYSCNKVAVRPCSSIP